MTWGRHEYGGPTHYGDDTCGVQDHLKNVEQIAAEAAILLPFQGRRGARCDMGPSTAPVVGTSPGHLWVKMVRVSMEVKGAENAQVFLSS